MTTTVFIWNNNMQGLNKYPGHACMSIGDAAVRHFDERQYDSYVSWIPDQEGGVSHSGKRKGQAQFNILHDFYFEGYAPDHIIRIPTNVSSEKKMITHWDALRNKTVDLEDDKRLLLSGTGPAPSYRLFRKNCSHMVQRVLKSGGINWSLNPLHWDLSRKHIIWTPLRVRELAFSYKGAKILTWFDWIQLQTLTGNEKKLLEHFQKRHARHGSSGAVARNRSWMNVRLLHVFGHSDSGYKNTAIVDLIENFGRPDMKVNVSLKANGIRNAKEMSWSIDNLIRQLDRGNYEYLQN
ncbi:hypothetical protein ACVBEF_20740 [Glaciimonas sp. GG7]